MDIKLRNKVSEIQNILEDEEQCISLSDPIAKMMLVAMAHQSCEIESKMDHTVDRLSERFCNEVLQRSNVKPQPAVSVLNIGNGCECAPYWIDENDTFTYKPSKCIYRPIFRNRIIPGRLAACFHNDIMLCPGADAVKASWPVKETSGEVWLAYETAGEVNTLEDAVIAFSHPLPQYGLSAEVGDVKIQMKPMMEDTPRSLNSNFMLLEFWKKSLLRYGIWLYRFGKCPDTRTLLRAEIPNWIMDAFPSDVLKPFLGNRYMWIRIKCDKRFTLPSDTAILFNSIPVANYDIKDAKLSYSEPIQSLENKKADTYFLDVVQNQDIANDFFIRDFDVCQYDGQRIREDITNLYNHYVNDYFAFVESNSLHDGAVLRTLRQSVMQVYDSLNDYRSGNHSPYNGVYAIRNPRNNQRPIVLSYYTSNGILGNKLKRGSLLTANKTAVGKVVAMIDAVGGRDKIDTPSAQMQLSRFLVNSNDRLFSRIDIIQYCKLEFMRAFGEEAIKYCNISLYEDSVVVEKHIEKCLKIIFDVTSDSLKEEMRNSDFFEYLEINIDLRKSFSWIVKIA